MFSFVSDENPDDIDNICDLLAAFETVFAEAIMFEERSYNDLFELDKQKIDDLRKKYKELNELGNKKFPNAEGAEECPNYKDISSINPNTINKLLLFDIQK